MQLALFSINHLSALFFSAPFATRTIFIGITKKPVIEEWNSLNFDIFYEFVSNPGKVLYFGEGGLKEVLFNPCGPENV